MDQRAFEEAVRSSWAVRESQAAKKLVSGKTDVGGRGAVLCKRLMSTGLYDATCLVTSSRDPDAPIRQPDPEIGFAAFVGAIAARIEQFSVLRPGRRA